MNGQTIYIVLEFESRKRIDVDSRGEGWNKEWQVERERELPWMEDAATAQRSKRTKSKWKKGTKKRKDEQPQYKRMKENRKEKEKTATRKGKGKQWLEWWSRKKCRDEGKGGGVCQGLAGTCMVYYYQYYLIVLSMQFALEETCLGVESMFFLLYLLPLYTTILYR